MEYRKRTNVGRQCSKLKSRNIRTAVFWDVLCRVIYIWPVSFVLGMLLSASLAVGELTVSWHCFAKKQTGAVRKPTMLICLFCMYLVYSDFWNVYWILFKGRAVLLQRFPLVFWEYLVVNNLLTQSKVPTWVWFHDLQVLNQCHHHWATLTRMVCQPKRSGSAW